MGFQRVIGAILPGDPDAIVLQSFATGSEIGEPAVEFLRRFLRHNLPKGCVKVRYYGIWSHSSRRLLDRARKLLEAPSPAVEKPDSVKSAAPAPERCPLCRVGFLAIVETLRPRRRFPP